MLMMLMSLELDFENESDNHEDFRRILVLKNLRG